MTLSNKQLITIIISCIVVYAISFLAILLNFQKGVEAILSLNIMTSFLVLFYWVRKQFRILKHYYELREITVLTFEVLVFGLSIFTMLNHPSRVWLEIVGYVFFWLHFTGLVLFLIVSLTFKMKKLF